MYISLDDIILKIQEKYGLKIITRTSDYYVLENENIIIRIDLWESMYLSHYFRLDKRKTFDRWANANCSFYFAEDQLGYDTIEESIDNFNNTN